MDQEFQEFVAEYRADRDRIMLRLEEIAFKQVAKASPWHFRIRLWFRIRKRNLAAAINCRRRALEQRYLDWRHRRAITINAYVEFGPPTHEIWYPSRRVRTLRHYPTSTPALGSLLKDFDTHTRILIRNTPLYALGDEEVLQAVDTFLAYADRTRLYGMEWEARNRQGEIQQLQETTFEWDEVRAAHLEAITEGKDLKLP